MAVLKEAGDERKDNGRRASDRIPVMHRDRFGIRGGSAVKGGDFNRQLVLARTHDHILFFSNKGRVYTLRGYRIPEAGRKGRGTSVVNLLRPEPGEKITAVINVPGFDSGQYLLMATDRGTVKRCRLAEFSSVRKNGLKAMALKDGEELIAVSITDGSASVLLASREGMAIRFDERDVRCMGRASHGVKGMDLAEGDRVAAMDTACGEDCDVLTVTENGKGKRTMISGYRKQNRGGKGRISYRLTRNTGKVAGMCIVRPGDGLFVFSAKGYVLCINVAELRPRSRNTVGVSVMRLREGDRVTSIAAVRREENE